jgi:hypothetical protein
MRLSTSDPLRGYPILYSSTTRCISPDPLFDPRTSSFLHTDPSQMAGVRGRSSFSPSIRTWTCTRALILFCAAVFLNPRAEARVRCRVARSDRRSVECDEIGWEGGELLGSPPSRLLLLAFAPPRTNLKVQNDADPGIAAEVLCRCLICSERTAHAASNAGEQCSHSQSKQAYPQSTMPREPDMKRVG